MSYALGFLLAALFWWAVWGRADRAQRSLDEIAGNTAMTDEMKAEHWRQLAARERAQWTEAAAEANAAKQAKADWSWK